VQPDTLLRWHRELFRRHWRRQSRAARPARRAKVPAETIALIRAMATANALWGAERIRGELLRMRQNLDTTHSPVTLWAALFTPALLSDSGYFGHDRRPPVLEHAPTIRE